MRYYKDLLLVILVALFCLFGFLVDKNSTKDAFFVAINAAVCAYFIGKGKE